MLYYIIRVADSGTLDKAFNSIENFLDINQEQGISWASIQSYQATGQQPVDSVTGQLVFGGTGQQNISSSMTDIYNTIENKATYHTIICCSFCGLYTLFILLFIQRLFKFTSFEQTME